MNNLIKVFPNSDLRCSHKGLGILAGKSDPKTLDAGNFLLFINRSQSAFKMLAAGNVLVHYKSPRGRVHIDAIQYLPHCFSGWDLNYDKALGMSLDKLLAKRLK